MLPAERCADAATLASKAQRLAKIRSLPLRSDVAEILSILDFLAEAHVTVEALRVSRVGVELNDRFLRQHVDGEIRAKSAALVAQWRSLATGKPVPAEEQLMGEMRRLRNLLASETGARAETAAPPPSRQEVLMPVTPSASGGSPASPDDAQPSASAATISPADFLARYMTRAGVENRQKHSKGRFKPIGANSVKKGQSNKKEMQSPRHNVRSKVQ